MIGKDRNDTREEGNVLNVMSLILGLFQGANGRGLCPAAFDFDKVW